MPHDEFLERCAERFAVGPHPLVTMPSIKGLLQEEVREYNVGEILLGNTQPDMQGEHVSLSFRKSVRAAMIGVPGTGKTVCLNNIGFQTALGGLKTVFLNDMKGNLYGNLCQPLQQKFAGRLPVGSPNFDFEHISKDFYEVRLRCITHEDGLAIDLLDAHRDDINSLFKVSSFNKSYLYPFLKHRSFLGDPAAFTQKMMVGGGKFLRETELNGVPADIRRKVAVVVQDLVDIGIIGRNSMPFEQLLEDFSLLVFNTHSNSIELSALDSVLCYAIRKIIEYDNPSLIIFDEAHRLLGFKRAKTDTGRLVQSHIQTKRESSGSIIFAGQTVRGDSAVDPKTIGMCRYLLLGGVLPDPDLKKVAEAMGMEPPAFYYIKREMRGKRWCLYDRDDPEPQFFWTYASPCKIAEEKNLK